MIFTINIESNISEEIKNIFPNANIIKIENKGVDVFEFLESIKYIRQNNIKTDFILKLYTKADNEWRLGLINLITNHSNLLVMKSIFKNIKNIGFI